MRQKHLQRYLKPLLEKLKVAEFDSTFVIKHSMNPDQGSKAYNIFKKKEDKYIENVMTT